MYPHVVPGVPGQRPAGSKTIKESVVGKQGLACKGSGWDWGLASSSKSLRSHVAGTTRQNPAVPPTGAEPSGAECAQPQLSSNWVKTKPRAHHPSEKPITSTL